MVNKLRGIIKVCAIKAPGFGERRKALLQDIAIVTGAEYIAKDLGMRIEETQIEQLGTARKVGSLTAGCDDRGENFPNLSELCCLNYSSLIVDTAKIGCMFILPKRSCQCRRQAENKSTEP